MSRDILFKAKRIDNREWIDGYYTLNPDGRNEILRKCETPPDSDPMWRRALISYEVDSSTVCQYTGLTDKNSRKIFEGDIVRDIFNSSVVGIVRYGEYRNTFNDDEYGGHVGFYIEWKEREYHLRKDLVYWVKNSEFIGNIFDNPELLKGAQNEH